MSVRYYTHLAEQKPINARFKTKKIIVLSMYYFETKIRMFKNLFERTAHRDWKTALFLFALIGCIHFIAAFLKSYPLNLFGMTLYALTTLIFVRKKAWKEIWIKKPTSSMYILWGSLSTVLFILVSYTVHYYTVDFSSSNFMALVAKQNIGFGVITKYNAWQYFSHCSYRFCYHQPFDRGIFLQRASYEVF